MQITSGSVSDTLRLGRQIARHLRKGDIICLCGDLGSGKTVLAKGIADGLGIDKKEVVSPTFILMRKYDGRLPMYHFDLYRLGDAGEMTDLGYEEYFFDNGVSVIEWAERLGGFTPETYLKIKIKVTARKSRKITVTAKGGRYKGVIDKINENTRT
jgi:tRNA threonylcarbamoyladenosine biosynthesis protein TsaE